MNQQVESYLEQVMRHTGISKLEKAEWIEEMSVHLHDETLNLMSVGHDEHEAVMVALQKFGQPSELRQKITSDTFGLSVTTILWLSLASFIFFGADIFLLQLLIHLGVPSAYQTYPNLWGYLSSMLFALSISPSLMLGLGTGLLTLIKTRRQADRMGIILSLAVFGALWVLIRLPLPMYANDFLYGLKDFATPDSFVGIISGVLILWGVLLYIWTKNKWVAWFPTILSILIASWFPIYTGLMLPRAFMFPNPQEYMINFIIPFSTLTIIRFLPIAILFVAFKVIDKYSRNHRSTLAV